MIARIGTAHTPLQAWRIYRRARRYTRLREHHELTAWLTAIRAVTEVHHVG